MIRRGFTFVEVITLLVVVGAGLMGVIALVSYGSDVSSRAQAESIALSTAMSVAHDPIPLLDPEVAIHWSYAPYPMEDPGNHRSEAGGFINGLYVTRVETSGDEDIIAQSNLGEVTVRSARIEVTVRETIGGEPLTAFVTRIVRRREGP